MTDVNSESSDCPLSPGEKRISLTPLLNDAACGEKTQEMPEKCRNCEKRQTGQCPAYDMGVIDLQ